MLDLTSFGYVSSARIIQLNRSICSNSVIVMDQIVHSIGADAAIMSLISARLGIRTRLITNNVGNDKDGKDLIQFLNRHDIQVDIKLCDHLVTPQLLDISDPEGARTLLTFIPGVVDQLLGANLKILGVSKLIYVDLYSEISKASLRAIDYATKKDVPIFVNLSHNNLRQKITMLKMRVGIEIVQASLDATSQLDAHLLVSTIFQETDAQIVLVTLGSKGALGATRSEMIQMPAYRIGSIKTTFGAGAAFSAGFAFAYLNKWNLEKSLTFACGLGTMNCMVPNGICIFSPKDVLAFIEAKDIEQQDIGG